LAVFDLIMHLQYVKLPLDDWNEETYDINCIHKQII
jgi:hypothetical protein